MGWGKSVRQNTSVKRGKRVRRGKSVKWDEVWGG